ncbi:hypothetical protein QR680_015364 [Steinernema hermaphroditum]|uniref:Metalloendopeptidase n=1 Tax=Steinernema hermaphroditum TaxID=289476 RepID=A0AA39H7F2_9BILA|nr:hypothetical protein QR680_015364 [Steinernema hermaphroditum]
MQILLILFVAHFSYGQSHPEEIPLRGKELLRKSLPDFKDIDAVAELIAEQRKKVQQRLSHGQEEVDKEMSELIEEAKKLNPKPLPPDAPRSIAEINSELGLDEVLVEGDMLMSLNEAKKHFGVSGQRSKRQAYQGWDYPESLWSSGVYYTYSDDLNKKGREAVDSAIAFWQKNTCLRFQKVDDGQAPSNPLLTFFPGDGCYSKVGRDPRVQEQHVSIGPGCETVDTAAHEIGHALGFLHEQGRWDRDQYVRIDFEGIEKNESQNYDKIGKNENNNYGKQYDFRGIMHYTDDAFAKDSKSKVMFARNPAYQMSLGGEPLPTFGDIFEMNSMYSCYETLSATGAWQTLDIKKVVGSGEGRPPNRTDPAHCTWHITAPAGKRIMYVVLSMGIPDAKGDSLCYSLCFLGGLSIKGIEKTWIPEGMRVCCKSQLNNPQTTASNLLVIQPWNTLVYTDFKLIYITVDGAEGGGPKSTPPTQKTRPTQRTTTTTTRRPATRRCRFNYQILSSDGSRCYTLHSSEMPYQGANNVCNKNRQGSISMTEPSQDEANLRRIFARNNRTQTYWRKVYRNNVCGIYNLRTNKTEYVWCSDTNERAAFICEAPSVRS